MLTVVGDCWYQFCLLPFYLSFSGLWHLGGNLLSHWVQTLPFPLGAEPSSQPNINLIQIRNGSAFRAMLWQNFNQQIFYPLYECHRIFIFLPQEIQLDDFWQKLMGRRLKSWMMSKLILEIHHFFHFSCFCFYKVRLTTHR